MFWNIVIAEESKICKRAILWVELVLLAALVGVMVAASYALHLSGQASGVAEGITWPNALPSMLTMASPASMGWLLVVVLVGTVVAQEYQWRTPHLWLSRGIPRMTVLGAKIVALLVPLILMPLVALIVGAALTAFTTVQLTGALDASNLNYVELGLSVLRTAFSLLPYAALVLFLSIISRAPVLPIGGGVAIVVVETLAGQMLNGMGGFMAEVSAFLPTRLATSLLDLNNAMVGRAAPPAPQGITLADPLLAAIGLAVYAAVFFGAAAFAFQRQDLTG